MDKSIKYVSWISDLMLLCLKTRLFYTVQVRVSIMWNEYLSPESRNSHIHNIEMDDEVVWINRVTV